MAVAVTVTFTEPQFVGEQMAAKWRMTDRALLTAAAAVVAILGLSYLISRQGRNR